MLRTLAELWLGATVVMLGLLLLGQLVHFTDAAVRRARRDVLRREAAGSGGPALDGVPADRASVDA